MDNLDKILKELKERQENEKRIQEEALKIADNAAKEREEALNRRAKSQENYQKLADAILAAEFAQKTINEANIESFAKPSSKKEEKDTLKIVLASIGIIAILGVASLPATTKLTKSNHRGLIPTEDNDASLEENAESSMSYDDQSNTVTVDEIGLTKEVFENIVTDYSKIVEANNLPVSTSDIVKFATIANIDALAEDNPELLKELIAASAKEEYLNDAAKLIGAAVMHNFTVWNNTNTTEGFIKVSEAIYGEQKELVIKIEEYTDKIAAAVNSKNKDLVNALISELIAELNSGSLSKLDDGVGFAIQVNIATISDGIAKNYINKENFDMLQILKTSEKYVSNIFIVYESCNGKSKTLSK